MVLLVGSSEDPVLNLLEDKATDHKIRTVRLNLDEFPGQETSTLRFGPEGSCFQPNATDTPNIRGVFNRSVPRSDFVGARSVTEPRHTFVQEEIYDFVFGGLLTLQGVKWINRPDVAFRSNIKIGQLRVAQSVGFSVPRTVVSTHRGVLTQFWHELDGRVVVKAVHQGYVSAGSTAKRRKVLFTNQVEAEHLTKLPEQSSVPILFQEMIPKQYELRIVVIEDRVFSCRIDAPQLVDWRTMHSRELPSRVWEIPLKVAKRATQLVQNLGLTLGVLDVVVDQEGNFVFLEVNQQGGWIWMEQKLDLPISDVILESLTNSASMARAKP